MAQALRSNLNIDEVLPAYVSVDNGQPIPAPVGPSCPSPKPGSSETDDKNAERRPPGTKKQTRWAVKIFREWLLSENENAYFEGMSKEKLAKTLERFYNGVTPKETGDDNWTSMKSIRAALQRHLSNPPYSQTYNIITHLAFRQANLAYKEYVGKCLQQPGREVKKQWIRRQDVAKLYEEVFTETPLGLQRRMFFEIYLHFGRRNRKMLMQLKKDDLEVHTEENGHEVVRLVCSEHAGEKCMQALPGDPKNCPVENFKKYIEHLDPESPWFFQRPRTSHHPLDRVWYLPKVVGTNPRLDMMPTMSRECRLSRRYSNTAVWNKNTVKIMNTIRQPLRNIEVVQSTLNEEMQDSVLETTAAEVRAEQELHSMVDSLEPPSMTDTQEEDTLSGAPDITVKTEEPDAVTSSTSSTPPLVATTRTIQPTTIDWLKRHPGNCVVCGAEFVKIGKNFNRYTVNSIISYGDLQKIFPERTFTQGPTKDYLCSDCLTAVRLHTVPTTGRSGRHTAKRKYVGPKEIPPPKIPRKRNYRKEACADISNHHYTGAFRLLMKESDAAKWALLRVAEELLQMEGARLTTASVMRNLEVPAMVNSEEKVECEPDNAQTAPENSESSNCLDVSDRPTSPPEATIKSEESDEISSLDQTPSSLVPPITIQPAAIPLTTEGTPESTVAYPYPPYTECVTPGTKPNSAQFLLKEDNFGEKFQTSLLHLYNTNYLHDVFIATAGPKMLSAHRVVLAANSPVFHNLFSSNREGSVVLLGLQEFPYDDLKTVIDAMYSGLLGLSAANIDSVYNIVKKLKIDAFIAMCDSVSSRLPRPLNANSGQSMPSTAFNLLQAKLQTMTVKPGTPQEPVRSAPSMSEKIGAPEIGQMPIEIAPCSMRQDDPYNPWHEEEYLDIKAEPTDCDQDAEDMRDMDLGARLPDRQPQTGKAYTEGGEQSPSTPTNLHPEVMQEEIEKPTRERGSTWTSKQTLWGVRVFRDWLRENGFSEEFESMETEQLAECLRQYYTNARCKDGSRYSQSAFKNLRYSVHRYVTCHGMNGGVNIMRHKEFETANAAFRAIMAELKTLGLDKINNSRDCISPEDVQLLCEKVSTDTPAGLQQRVFFEVGIHFGILRWDCMRELRKDSFQICKDSQGVEYMLLNGPTKGRGDIMYSLPGNVHCPVLLLKKYLSKLCKNSDGFYQKPKAKWTKNKRKWYDEHMHGVMALEAMMKSISSFAGLSKAYSNGALATTRSLVMHTLASFIEDPLDTARAFSGALSDYRQGRTLLSSACSAGCGEASENSLKEDVSDQEEC